jgi:hypothetical protein
MKIHHTAKLEKVRGKTTWEAEVLYKMSSTKPEALVVVISENLTLIFVHYVRCVVIWLKFGLLLTMFLQSYIGSKVVCRI